MKLLFDQNISHKLVNRLKDLYPNLQHVREVGLKDADDRDIWEYACSHGFIIVSKDEDFHQMSFVYGPPPKVVWVCLGYCTTTEIENTLRRYYADLAGFSEQAEEAFLIIGTMK